MSKLLENIISYISQAIGGIFAPNEEPVPEIGTQPFEGEPYANYLE
ncbi:hypothetical protein Lepto7376_3342 [[Leptolyngbya] sp. PCC 7376]|nr:hypothetical protein [[Leptolyngbya] sp. PCC 7376]AFY39559.1 hypothetical protein Lepto7376_3342 [[Leptolyngbya] sp. PCC 7376]